MVKIELRDNVFMQKFAGPESVDHNDDQFWYQLLTCSFNFMRVQDPKVVDRTLGPFIDLLALNNSQSLNFGSLVRVAIDRIARVKSQSVNSTNPYYVYQSFNAIYLIRSICKNYIENSSEEKLVQSFSARQDKDVILSGPVMLDQYISVLIEIIVDMPLNESTYLLQVEAINSLIVLLSVQMYSNAHANQSVIFRSLMHKKCSIHALVLTKTLLSNFIRQVPLPEENNSIIIGLASGLWKVLTLGYGYPEDEASEMMPPLARQSLLLLNVLTNHYTTEKNPYREALISCQDSKFNLTDPQVAFDNANNDALTTATTSQSVLTSNSIKIEFDQLYDSICKHLQNDQVALLLYLLLHSNKMFKPYILTTAASKLDQLVLPLLKVLHSSIQLGSHHIYMVLIVFLILSESTAFNESIHNITLRGVPWFKDRILTEISLGSFTTLIIIRSFQYNTFRVKDKFLHTNLFATLGNLSNHFQRLHPYVCQRLVDLLERLTKHITPNSEHINGSTTSSSQIHMNNNNNNTEQLQDTSHIEITMDDTKGNIDTIEVVRMILEVINNSLATQLANNPDLIYTLLYKKEVFTSLMSSHNSFYNMVINIERILTYFYEKIESYDYQLSVEEIKGLIETTSLEWNFDQPRDANPELLFRYVEDEQPEEFFIPYMWTRIYYSSGIAWNPKRIVLFNPEIV